MLDIIRALAGMIVLRSVDMVISILMKNFVLRGSRPVGRGMKRGCPRITGPGSHL